MKRRKKVQLSSTISIRNRFKVFRIIIYAIVVLLISIVTVMCTCSMEDAVEGNGTVVGIRDYDLKTLVSARIVKVHCHNGQEVERGTLLLEFDSRDQQDKIASLEQELEELEQELTVKDQALKILNKDPLPEHFRHTKLQLEEAREKYARHKHELEVYSDLYKRKAITRREFLEVEMAHLTTQMNLRRYEEDWKKVESGIIQDILKKAEEEYSLLKTRIEGKKKEIAIAVKQLEDYKLYAPDAGVITDIPPRPGSFHERGEVVVKFSANQNKKVIALIDEKQIYKVVSGQPVRIYCQQYNYLDYGYFTGKVTDIYQLPVEKDGINYYPVRIVLDGEEYPLRFGSGCEVTIVTGHDRIIYVMLGVRSKRILPSKNPAKKALD
ncbi:MAG: HlyD family efflux transporter periplasmic adaptor subunit [Lentisphaerae bacterium]|nr:HlyD family efflux transporter periplasmic adaptor subunit [Lentisphaerota bacterium]